MLKLYDYFRSSAAFRVRIALNLKGLYYTKIPISLVENQQSEKSYLEQNPLGLVPSLVTPDNTNIHQSLAIIEYLELTYPNTLKLIPSDIMELVYVKSIAYDIAMDIHPLNNLRILKYLQGPLRANEEEKNIWYQHWIREGFTGLEKFIVSSGRSHNFCLGDEPTLADVVLIPQIYNAKRFKCNLDNYPTLSGIYEKCLQLEAFKTAFPE